MLRRFGRLVHPTKCSGASRAVQAARARCTWEAFTAQAFPLPPLRCDELSPWLPASVRAMARFERLVFSTWMSMGPASRISIRALAAMVDSRPPARPDSWRKQRRSWSARDVVKAAAREGADWWAWSLPRLIGAPLFGAAADGDIAGDASDAFV